MRHPVEIFHRSLEMKDCLNLGKYTFEIVYIKLIVKDLGMNEIIIEEYRMRTEVLTQTYNK